MGQEPGGRAGSVRVRPSVQFSFAALLLQLFFFFEWRPYRSRTRSDASLSLSLSPISGRRNNGEQHKEVGRGERQVRKGGRRRGERR